MANDPLIHCLGYLADEGDNLTMQKVRLQASNGYELSLAYSPDDDVIYSTSPRSVSKREHWNDIRGNDVDEKAAAQWRQEGIRQIRSMVEGFFADKPTTVDI